MVRSGELKTAFDYIAFDKLLQRSLEGNIKEYDHSLIVIDIDDIMTQLGIMLSMRAAFRLSPENMQTQDADS